MIGTYSFFTIDFITGKIILTTGKSNNSNRRLTDYKTTNAGIEFQYFKECPENELLSQEQDLQNYCKDNGLKEWGKGGEQFVVEDLEYTKKILNNYFGNPFQYSKSKNIDYSVATLFGQEDIRDFRPNCWWNTRDKAMILTAAGPNERVRKVKTFFKLVKAKRKIQKLEVEQSVPTGQNAWNIIQVERKNERYRLIEMLKKYNISEKIMEDICTNLKIT